MLAGLEMPPAVEAAPVVAAVLPDLRSGNHRGVVVHSTPGAGSSLQVVRAAAESLVVTAYDNELGHIIAARRHQASKQPIAGLSTADTPRAESRFTRRWSREAPSGFEPRTSIVKVSLPAGTPGTRQVKPHAE